MSDAKPSRESYRRDGDGQLTVWGARDVLLVEVDRLLVAAFEADTDELAAVQERAVRRLERALDDVQDAYLRTHEEFGCVSIQEVRVWGDDERERYVCSRCREAEREAFDRDEAVSAATRVICEAVPGASEAEVRESLEQFSRGEVTPATTRDEEDVAFDEAMRARPGRGVLWEDLLEELDFTEDEKAEMEKIKRRIRAAVPEPRDETWDAAREVREARDADVRADVRSERDVAEACYDDGDGQAADRDDQAESSGLLPPAAGIRFGWRNFELSTTLDVRPGDIVNVRLATDDSGELRVAGMDVWRDADRDGEA